MSLVRELERRLAEKETEIIRRNEVITYLEKELDERDASIRHLRNEIDKFRQVVRPITQQLVCGYNTNSDPSSVEWDPVERLRTKRQAISAEPIVGALGDLKITKIPKSAK